MGARVSIGSNDSGQFQLSVILEAFLPNVTPEQTQGAEDAEHQACPYSNATRGNIDVQVKIVDD